MKIYFAYLLKFIYFFFYLIVGLLSGELADLTVFPVTWVRPVAFLNEMHYCVVAKLSSPLY